MLEPKIELVVEGKLNIDQPFLQFNVTKRKICEELL